MTDLATVPCCDLHNQHCEPPADLCCMRCTEASHPDHRRGEVCVLAALPQRTGVIDLTPLNRPHEPEREIDMALLDRIKNALLRRPTRVMVEITCPHGPFIPAAYTPGRSIRRYGCDKCRLTLRLSTFHGPVNW